jgi:branched-subunit amino acid transport protein
MDQSNIVILAIVVTSLATYLSRFLGAVTSEKLNIKSKTFQWFNCVAYSTLAALISRMIVFPAGILNESELIFRILVLIVCVAIYLLSKKNLVIPTILSAVFLIILNNIN